MKHVNSGKITRRFLHRDIACFLIASMIGCSSTQGPDSTTQPPENTGTPSVTTGTPAQDTPAPTPAASGPYEPDPTSLATHPLPQWYADARLGLLIHYGPYSVPAFAPRGEYAEWYAAHTAPRRLEEVVPHPDPMPEAVLYHQDTWGENVSYDDFTDMLSTSGLDSSALMSLARRAGMGYVVATAKHHDGYVLYDSSLTRYDWEDAGPGGDLLGELKHAAQDQGLKFGLYYSLLDWNQADYPDREDYVAAYLRPQLEELIRRYEPAVLWADGNWGHSSQYWESAEILADYYNTLDARGLEGVVNDRFGLPGDFATLEYTSPAEIVLRPTEVARGMGESFGYNQNEKPGELEEASTLLLEFIDAAAKGANYLLNVGLTGDGSLPEEQQAVLETFAAWMGINGEAIYGTRPWVDYGEGSVRYTLKEVDPTHATLFAIAPAELGDLFLPSLHTDILDIAKIRLLGSTATVEYTQTEEGLQIFRPATSLPVALAYAIDIQRSPVELGPLNVSSSAAALGDQVSASIGITNRTSTEVTETLTLVLNDLPTESREVTLPPNGTSRVEFTLPTLLSGDNTLRIGYRTNRVLIDPIYIDRNDNGARDMGEAVATNLRDALALAVAGDILRMLPGYYRADVNTWPVDIGIPVRIQGEPGVVLDGGGATQVLTISTYGVTIQGLEIGGLGSDEQGLGAAVNVDAVNQVILRNNFIRGALRFAGGQSHIVQGNRLEGGGVSLQAAFLAEVTDNLIVDNRWGPAVSVRDCQGITIRGNRLTDNLAGIQAVDSYTLELSSNEINSRWWGIQLEGSSRANVLSNVVTSTMRGLELTATTSSTITANRIEDCDTGMLFQQGSEKNTVQANTLTQSRVGLFLWDTGVQTITGNNLSLTESYVLYKNANPVQSADGNYWGGQDPSTALGGAVSVSSWASEPF